MGFIKRYLLGRLREASTWKGLIAILSGIIGYKVTGGQTEAVAGVCVSVYTALSVFFPDKFGVTPVATIPQPLQSGEGQTHPEISDEIQPGPPAGSGGFSPNGN